MELAKLFPRPRRASLGEPARSDLPVIAARDPAVPRQGYKLLISDNRALLLFADEAGRRYGEQTLEQLRRLHPNGLPKGEIDDWPDFPVRGYMLDVSRNRVPTRQTLEHLVARLEAARFNHLQLYVEHTFAYSNHEPVWRDASPMTGDDLAWLACRCSNSGIELGANQNTFGHMGRWLAHPAYRQRAEAPGGWIHGGSWHPPTVLAPTVDNAAFALELVREQVDSFSARLVNVGCDEVWELGKGISARDVAKRGRLAVYAEHLRRIAYPLLSGGLSVQFWADMVEQGPACVRALADSSAIAAVWGYRAPLKADANSIGLARLPPTIRRAVATYLEGRTHGFDRRLSPFSEVGFRTWVVPGTSGWSTFVGQHTNARGNIRDAVESGIAHGVEGILLAEWGDNGHLQPPFATLPALLYAGAAAWCYASNGQLTDEELGEATSNIMADSTGLLGASLIRLGSIADLLGVLQPNGAAFFHAAVRSRSGVFLRPNLARLEAAVNALDVAVETLGHAAPRVKDGELLIRETVQAAALARHGLSLLAGDAPVPASNVCPAGRALLDEQRTVWLARSRAGGLDDSLCRLRLKEGDA